MWDPQRLTDVLSDATCTFQASFVNLITYRKTLSQPDTSSRYIALDSPCWDNMCDTKRKMEEYERKRQALVTEEKGQRVSDEGRLEAFDARVIAQASQTEKRAKKIVKEIKNSDIVVYKNDNKDVGDSFLKNVDTIERTELFKVAKKMPKGSHLHCHFNTGLKPSFGIEQARGRSPMCIKSTLPLATQENKDNSEIAFQVYPVEDDNDEKTAKNKDIFSPSYSGGKNADWMRYNDFCNEFDGGLEACEEWLSSKMVLTEKQVYENQTLEG
jgi:adenosine deaminase CECR1